MVEDNLADVGLVREALMENGVEGELLVISDGDWALRFVQTLETKEADCPDLIIIDLNLPKRPGREVLKAVRQSAKYKHAAVVIWSSSDSAQDKNEAMALGADRYIRKPSRLDEFLSLGAIFKSIIEGPGKGN